MLTSLYVETIKKESLLDRFICKLRRDKIRTYIKQASGISIRCVEYVSYSGKVNFIRLDRIIGAQRNRLLCDKSIELPKDMGYKRFDDSAYKERLCTNLALTLLKSAENSHISVGIIDMDAQFTTLPQDVLSYTDNVVVVTACDDIYKEVSQQLIEETGAIIRLSKSFESLNKCELVIAPSGVQRYVASADTVLLTTRKSSDYVNVEAVSDYTVKLPKMLLELCPKGIDATYFAGALYLCQGVFELGSLIPRLCISKYTVHTVASLKILLSDISSKNLT